MNPQVKNERQHRLLQGIVSVIRLGIMVFDTDERLVWWNPWLELHAQRPAEEVLGQSFSGLFPALVGSRVHEAVQSALRNNFSSLLSHSLNKAPFPLYACASDQAQGLRMQQALQVMPIGADGNGRYCMVHVTDVSLQVGREAKLRRQALDLEAQAFADGLTGIPNRRRFDMHLENEFRRARRLKVPLSLVMIDVDCFKRYNDNYGHQRGDTCLIEIAEALSKAVTRPQDLLARYGGEEFVAILPDTEEGGALLVAERLRRQVEQLQIEHGHSSVGPHATVTLGVATLRNARECTVRKLLGAADMALYRAKQQGRNRVAACQPEGESEEAHSGRVAELATARAKT